MVFKRRRCFRTGKLLPQLGDTEPRQAVILSGLTHLAIDLDKLPMYTCKTNPEQT